MRFLVMMTETDHFARWDAFTEAEQQAVLAGFEAFDRAVEARGTVLGGEALVRPERARTIGPGIGAERTVTEGPYAETVEQLGGFYLVETDDVDDLLEVCGILAGADVPVEVRAAVDHSGS